MSRPAYSAVLLNRWNVATTVFTTPDLGHLTVVRDIDVYWRSADPLGLIIAYDANTDAVFWAVQVASSNRQTYSFRGRQVFEAGATIGFLASSPVDVRISGYLLTP